MDIGHLEQIKGTLKIILYLYKHENTDISKLIRENQIPRQTCYDALTKLEDTGILTVLRESLHKPTVICHLTQKGFEIAKHLQRIEGTLENTVEGYRQALSELEMTSRPDESSKRKKLTILLEILSECISCGQWNEAMDYAVQAIALSRKLHDREGLIIGLRNKGRLLHRMQEFDKAMDCFKKSAQLAQLIEDHEGLASDNYNLGWISEKKGKYSLALDHYRKSEEYSKKCGCEMEEGRAYMGIGRVLSQKGNYVDSVETMKKAVAIFEKLKSQEDLPKAYTNLGSTEFYVNIDNAIKWHEKCIEVSEKQKDLRTLGYGLSNVAGCYIEKIELDKAVKNLERALSIFKKLNDKRMVSSILTKYARVSLMKGRRKSAKNYLNKAMEIAKNIGVPSEIADIHYQFGITFKEREEIVKAGKSFEKALRIYEDMGETEMVKRIKEELKELRSL
jgi:tetratricopeptide (TPR) repeat protein